MIKTFEKEKNLENNFKKKNLEKKRSKKTFEKNLSKTTENSEKETTPLEKKNPLEKQQQPFDKNKPI